MEMTPEPDSGIAANGLFHLHAAKLAYREMQQAITRMVNNTGRPDDYLDASEGGKSVTSYLAALEDEVSAYVKRAAFPDTYPAPLPPDPSDPLYPQWTKELLGQLTNVQLAVNDLQTYLTALRRHIGELRATGTVE